MRAGGEIKGHKQGTFVSFDFLKGKHSVKEVFNMRKYWKEKNRYIAEKEKSADAGIKRMMLTSVLGMLICVVCLAGTTWAWFTANSGIDDTDNPLSVETAQVEVGVRIDTQAKGTVSGGDPQTITIAENENLSVTLKAGGTSKKKYCYVTVDGDMHYVDLSSNDSITFTVCSSRGSMKIEASWSAPKSGSPISSGATIGKGELPETASEDNSSGGNDAVNNGGSTEDNSSKKSEQGNTDGKVTENGNNNGSGSEPDLGDSETQGESEE